MKKLLLSTILIVAFSISTFAQTTLKGAENYSITLPQNWQRTLGANALASAQWEHNTEEIYGYVMFEHVDEIELAELKTDIESNAEYALNDFNELAQYKLLNSKKFKTTSGFETTQREFSYYDEENDIKFHMLINIFRSESFLYKMINFGTDETFKNGKKDIDFIINNIKLP